jgi:hypothetical protein
MKNLTKVIVFIGSILLLNNKVNGQADILSHAGLSTYYLGWNSLQNFDLNIKHDGAQNVNFYTSGSQRMTILGNTNPGFVGIGIATPSFKLDVDGDINMPGWSTAYRINGSSVLRHGFVGGTPNCLYVGVGAGALGSANWPANTFVGYNAGKLANTASGSYGYNTFIGYSAGANNLDGNENTFVGANAGESNTVGNYNTFLGIESGQTNTLGNDNTFLGHYTGLFNQSCSNNTAVGSDALFSQVGTGFIESTYNVAIGDNSLFYTNGGKSNSALGSSSGLNNITGSFNTYLGYQADGSISSLTDATAIGYASVVTTDHNMILGNNSVNVGIGISGVVGGAQAKLHVQRDLTSRVVNPTSVKIQNDDVDFNGRYVGTSFGATVTTLGENQINYGGTFKSSNARTNYAGNFDATEIVNENANWGNFGINSIAANATSNYGGQFQASSGLSNFGVMSQAVAVKETTTNWGVAGFAYPDIDNRAFNVGIYGYAPGLAFPSPQPTLGTGSYAGYFNGDVAVTGNLWFPSDSTNKINIRPLNDVDSILSQLNLYSYNFDTTKLLNVANVPHALQFGLMSQEVETVAPNLVINTMFPPVIDSLGKVIAPGQKVKMMNYVNIIPLLVSGYNQQKAVNDALKSSLDSLIEVVSQCCAANSSTSQRQRTSNSGGKTTDNNTSQINKQNGQQLTTDLSDVAAIVLDQNSPNPFADQTKITWNIPTEKVSIGNHLDAKLYFYDRSGSIIKTVKIEQTGFGELIVYANNLSNGTYTYTLIVDGKVIDSKKMVKTK